MTRKRSRRSVWPTVILALVVVCAIANVFVPIWRPAVCFRHVSRSEFAKLAGRDSMATIWLGCHYCGSDEEAHYFVSEITFRTTSLRVARDECKVAGEMPFSSLCTHWRDIRNDEFSIGTLYHDPSQLPTLDWSQALLNEENDKYERWRGGPVVDPQDLTKFEERLDRKLLQAAVDHFARFAQFPGVGIQEPDLRIAQRTVKRLNSQVGGMYRCLGAEDRALADRLHAIGANLGDGSARLLATLAFTEEWRTRCADSNERVFGGLFLLGQPSTQEVGRSVIASSVHAATGKARTAGLLALAWIDSATGDPDAATAWMDAYAKEAGIVDCEARFPWFHRQAPK